jgi:hypothetical protein
VIETTGGLTPRRSGDARREKLGCARGRPSVILWE